MALKIAGRNTVSLAMRAGVRGADFSPSSNEKTKCTRSGRCEHDASRTSLDFPAYASKARSTAQRGTPASRSRGGEEVARLRRNRLRHAQFGQRLRGAPAPPRWPWLPRPSGHRSAPGQRRHLADPSAVFFKVDLNSQHLTHLICPGGLPWATICVCGRSIVSPGDILSASGDPISSAAASVPGFGRNSERRPRRRQGVLGALSKSAGLNCFRR